MKVLDRGHRYLLKSNGLNHHKSELTFYKDPKINEGGYEGTTNQEVIRALIDRVKFLDTQKYWEGNSKIIFHLRQALILHEVRHLERCVEENYPIENIKLDEINDHFIPNKSLWGKDETV